MARRCSLPPLAQLRSNFRIPRLFNCAALFLLMFLQCIVAFADGGKAKTPPRPCAFRDNGFDPSTDVQALREYQDAIAKLLKQEKFAELDCLADAARTGKTRFAGGTWKLANLYAGLQEPRPGHPTEEDWLQHLRRWGIGKAEILIPLLSDRARGLLHRHDWNARGLGDSDSVSDSGWKLFGQRLEKAKTILDRASSLHTKCPEWFRAMLEVALGQSWGPERDAALFEQAVAFEPAYQSYYRNYVVHLLPRWSGGRTALPRVSRLRSLIGVPGTPVTFFIFRSLTKSYAPARIPNSLTYPGRA